MSDQNAIFEERLQAWFHTLPPEERCAALTVTDGAFVSTLIHFASLSTSSHDDGKAEIDGRGAEDADSVSSCNWNKEILLSDIAKVYSSYRERFGMSVESKSCANLTMRQPSRLSSGPLEMVANNPEFMSVEWKSGEKLENSKQLIKASDTVAGDSDADIIHRSRIGPDDAFRIQGFQEAINTMGTNDDESTKKKDEKNSCHDFTAPDSFVRELLLVFPGVLQVANEQGVHNLTGLSKVYGDPSPILSLLPSALQNFDPISLCLQGYSDSEGATWLTQLREHSTAGSDNERLASLSLMVLSRLCVSATEAFLACKNKEADQLKTAELIATAEDAIEDAVNVEEEHASFEHYTTPPEEDGSNSENEEIDVTTLNRQVPLPSSQVLLNPTRHYSVESVNTRPSEALSLELCEAVKKFSVESDFKVFAAYSIGESTLPLIPLEAVLGFDDSKMLKLDEALKKFLLLVLPRAVHAKAIEEQTKKIALVVSQEIEGTVSFDQSQNAFGKKKKKKKKRKRKNSNAGSLASSAGKEVGSPELSKSLASLAAAIALPQTPSMSPRKTKQLPVDCRGIDLPMLPATDCFDSSRTEQPAKRNEFAADTGVTVYERPIEDDSSIVVSRSEDMGLTCVVVPSNESRRSRAGKAVASAAIEKTDEDGDVWETVEAKGRGKNRNKIDSRRDTSYSSPYHHSNSHSSRKVKSGRTSASRRKNASRRMVRDILFSVLDSVEIEVRRRRRAADAKSFEERRRRSGQPRPIAGGGGVPQSTSATSIPVSLRDVVLRKQSANPREAIRGQPLPRTRMRHPSPYAGIVRAALNDVHKKFGSSDVKSKGTQTQTARADQSTAQTIPETLSGASANTQSSLATEEVDNVSDKLGRRESGNGVLIDGTSSAVDGGDEPEASHVKTAVSTEKESSPAPPLPTLLGPGNTNSATSSVASSLEAPHASNHRHHHHSSSCKENDVGYHLLDVCDRLSRDMNVFMTRRSLALTARRRERGALLTALQGTVSNIWAGHGSVEMYGSCATQLDLPSSDLDAVILGLDSFPGFTVDTCVATPNGVSKKQNHYEPSGTVDSVPSSPTSSRSPYHQKNMASSLYGRHLPNGERVLLLAAELERQPWAVQVKAIPTATVPVVKILADPSKLPGAVTSNGSGGDWMLQQHHMAAQAAATAAGINPPPLPSSQTGFLSPPPLTQGQPSYAAHTPPPWRGADVMNGLFSLDITFEGPEHGGLGSTIYSANVVQEACNETGLPPEGTPVVQVLMVLKELLAQRRLNEPFSGGLSSYALLLLVNAVSKERTIIREEMERIERHRALVAAENTAIATSDFVARALSSESKEGKAAEGPLATLQRQSGSTPRWTPKPAGGESTERLGMCTTGETIVKAPILLRETQLVMKKLNCAKRSAPTARVSSWASIAKKSAHSFAQRVAPTSQSTARKPESGATKSQQKSRPPKATSFAEAVSRKQQDVEQDAQKQRGQPPKKEGDLKNAKRVESFQPESKHHKKAHSKTTSGAAQVPSKPLGKERLQSMAIAVSYGEHTVTTKAPPLTAAKHDAIKDAVQHMKSNTFAPLDSSLSGASSLFPQGSDDVLEVLCSGETSAGKLLMHFLLYYGEHFDSRTNAIDVIGSVNSNRTLGTGSSAQLSPYIPRQSGGTIDPITGMLTVDPIVVYDPWEGGVGNNVARSCYAWSSIRWHFAQCYMTLSSAVERGGNTATTSTIVTETNGSRKAPVESTNSTNEDTSAKGNATAVHTNETSNSGHPHPVDTVSPLLELLLSF